jgi:pyruvate/2-oxoglutarate dehydrogenase complex dihydrolipoamide acyltransferase (E2) component
MDPLSARESLDHAERWLRDGLAVLRPALSVYQITVDMTHATRQLEELRRAGVHASSTHLVVHAAARALGTIPHLHQIVAGTKRERPTRVDIGLSVAGETFIAPVMVIEGADQKTIAEIASETAGRAAEIKQADQQMIRALRTWGRLIPVGVLRRAVLRLLFRSPTFRRKGAGTFQVSMIPVDWALTSTFSTAGVLVGGQTRLQVVVVDGQPAVRPIMKVTLSSDHGVWDGRAASRFLAAVKTDLETLPFDQCLKPQR